MREEVVDACVKTMLMCHDEVSAPLYALPLHLRHAALRGTLPAALLSRAQQMTAFTDRDIPILALLFACM